MAVTKGEPQGDGHREGDDRDQEGSGDEGGDAVAGLGEEGGPFRGEEELREGHPAEKLHHLSQEAQDHPQRG